MISNLKSQTPSFQTAHVIFEVPLSFWEGWLILAMTVIVPFLGILIMLCQSLYPNKRDGMVNFGQAVCVDQTLSKCLLHGYLILIQLEAPLTNSGKVRVKMVRSGLPCLTYFSYLPHYYKSYFSPTFSTCLHRRHLLSLLAVL